MSLSVISCYVTTKIKNVVSCAKYEIRNERMEKSDVKLMDFSYRNNTFQDIFDLKNCFKTIYNSTIRQTI